ncbi:unnamed protein product [Gadus morhua 'NCC']
MTDLEVRGFEVPGQNYTLPSTGKKVKKPKKDHKRKDKSGVAMKKEGRIQKKKEKKKLREAMKGMKDNKKKRKKDRAMKLAVEVDLISTQANSALQESQPLPKTDETLVKKLESSRPHCCDLPSQDGSPSILRHRKVTKKKKKVAFELGYGSLVAKYPKVVAPSTQSPEVNVSSSMQSEGSMGSDILVEGALNKHFKTLPQNNDDSQCTSDDINSQDLFITQKRFRAPSLDQSSEEITEEGIGRMRHVHQYGEMREKVRAKVPKKQQGHHRLALEEPSERTEKASTSFQKLEMMLLEEDMSLKPISSRCIPLHLQPKQDAKTIQPAPLTPKRMSYIVNPKPLSLSIEVMKSPEVLVSEPAILEPLPNCKVSTSDTSTQTENFFSTELCSYLKFYQQSRLDNNRLDLLALDLSLPPKMRTDPGKSLLDSVKTSALKVKSVVGATGTKTLPPIRSAFRPGKHKDFSVPPPSSTQVKVSKETLASQAPCTAQGKVETTPSPQSEAEPKSSDTTVSSEESIRSGRADLVQVKAVQMRLNESFFFRSKGEGLSPRPESPLMKLIQGREKKSRKKR